MHLAFNMFVLYTFGPMIESYLGRRRFLLFYLVCGAMGAGLYLLLWEFGFLHPKVLITGAGDLSGFTPLVGASAGIFGVLVAGAMVAPDIVVQLLIPPIPMR